MSAQAICDLQTRWLLDFNLTQRLTMMAATLPFGVSIISGFRTEREQASLISDPSKQAASDRLSNHRACPARAADLRPDVPTTIAVKLAIGTAAEAAGLRWGGGAPRDAHGIPVGNEWRHVDLGRRPQ